jgi:hypothetical protein
MDDKVINGVKRGKKIVYGDSPCIPNITSLHSQVLQEPRKRLARGLPSKSSVEPVLLRDHFRYSVNILLNSILSPIFHPR